MKRNMLFGTMLSAVLAVGLNAQTGTQTPATQGQESQKQQQVTVTGCLMEGAGMTAGATGTGSGTSTGTSGTQTSAQRSGSTDAKFHLTNAQITPAGKTATGGTGTTGTTGAPSGTTGATSNTKVQLVGGDQQDLQRYINSQVEVTGVLVTDRSGAGAGTGTGTGTGTGSATGAASASRQSGDSMTQRVRVTSVRQVSTTCTEK